MITNKFIVNTLLIMVFLMCAAVSRAEVFAQLESASTVSGYLARLLINEVPFPGERAYVSETATKEAMVQILWVLHGRLTLIPAGYTQQQIAGVKAKSIIDVITGTDERRQCEGFYKNSAGKFVTDSRVEERLDYLLKIANKGNKPGRFSSLLNFGQDLARAYVNEGIEGTDRFADLKRIGRVEVTGHAYSWMTDVNNYHPGGNFVFIPSEQEGSLGGNRFFTLRKEPK
jgi:hypothetical protein